MNTFNRRRFIQASAATGLAFGLPSFASAAGAIKLGSVLDVSGIFEGYGKPMLNATRMAIDEINAAGGLLGEKVDLVDYDTQSNIALYTQYAQQLVKRDKANVVHGGILSASREAIRQTLRKGKTLYFYNVQYEGGVCDRNIFCTGVTPAQSTAVLIPEAVKRWGKKAYILAADYNYGQITAKWVTHYLRQQGGDAIQTDFFPLTVNDFNSTIAKIQQAKPDMVVSILVGGAHLSFYRQWAAAGMKQRIPMCSTTLTVGNEHLVLTPEEGNGILVAYNYASTNPSPANKKFRAEWARRFGDVKTLHELAAATYQGIHLWAEGVRRANSDAHDAVIKALESGVSIEGPSGKVSIDPKTHHCTLDIHILEVMNQQLNVVRSFPQRPPLDTQQVCDLEKNPNTNKQFEIKI